VRLPRAAVLVCGGVSLSPPPPTSSLVGLQRADLPQQALPWYGCRGLRSLWGVGGGRGSGGRGSAACTRGKGVIPASEQRRRRRQRVRRPGWGAGARGVAYSSGQQWPIAMATLLKVSGLGRTTSIPWCLQAAMWDEQCTTEEMSTTREEPTSMWR